MHAPDKNDITYIEERYGKIAGWIPGAVDQKTGKINPQVTQAYLGGNTFASVFHVKPVYYETYAGEWRPLSEVTTWHGNHRIEFNKDWWKVHPRYMAWLEKRMKLISGKLLIPSLFQDVVSPYSGVIRELHQSLVPLKLGLTTSTFYPDPNTETTSVDGYCYYDNNTTAWTTMQSASASAGVNDSATALATYVGNYNPGTNAYWLYRSFVLFDTSGINDSDTIDSATFSLYGQTIVNEDLLLTNKSFRVVSTTPASNTALSTDDYDQCGTTAGATDKAITSLTTAGYNDWSLNATGLSWITKTGVSKFGLRHTADTENEEPDAPGSADDYNMFYCYSADQTGTANDPKLVVEHSAATSTFIPRISFIM